MSNPNIPPGPGRPKGLPNKATATAREAIAAFVESNVERLNGWLDDIAKGHTDENGKVLRQPDPMAAYRCMMDVLEYHIPKLARAEIKHEGRIELTNTEDDAKVLERFMTAQRSSAFTPRDTIQ